MGGAGQPRRAAQRTERDGKKPRRKGSFGALGRNFTSGFAVGDRLLDELIEGFRLLLFGDGTDDGITDDVTVLIDHIGGGVGKDIGGKGACLAVGRY